MSKSKYTLECEFLKGQSTFTYHLHNDAEAEEVMKEIEEKMRIFSSKVKCDYSTKKNGNVIILIVNYEETHTSKREGNTQGLVF